MNLTARQQQIVALVVDGKSNKEIALEIHCAVGTVKQYINKIFRKTGCHSRVDLAVRAVRLELGAET